MLVDTVVTDKKGNYIRDLTGKDFRVWEDNKEQRIESFSFEADPASPTSAQQHYLVLFFDNSTMQFGEQAQARQAALKFIDTNSGPNRLTAIVDFGGTLRIAQNFTADAARLKQVVNGVKFSAVSPNGDVASLGGPQLSSAAADFGARDVLLSLRSLAKNLASVPGRKTLVFLTAGFVLTSELRSELTAVIDVCNKANVAIYPIDVRGLVVACHGRPGPPRGANEGLPDAPPALQGVRLVAAAFVQQRPGGSPTTRSRRQSAPEYDECSSTRYASSQHSLANGEQFSRSEKQSCHESEPTVSDQQSIQSAADDRSDDSTERFGKSGCALRACQRNRRFCDREYQRSSRGIAKDRKRAKRILRAELFSGRGIQRMGAVTRCALRWIAAARTSGRGVAIAAPSRLICSQELRSKRIWRIARTASVAGNVNASMKLPFFYTSPNTARVDVAMEIPPGALKFEKEKGKLHSAMNVLGIAYAADGTVAAKFSDTATFDFENKKEVEAFQEQPVHYENQFDVASGQYNLKVVFSSGGESFGKLQMPLVVDPYDDKKFGISAVALSRKFHRVADLDVGLDAALLEDKTPLVSAGMQVTPSGSNIFKKTEPAAVYVEIYEPLLLEPNARKSDCRCESWTARPESRSWIRGLLAWPPTSKLGMLLSPRA